jgi:predicted nucleic acid-binding protein
MTPVFVDTSFFVALLSAKDDYHAVAVETMQNLPRPLVTTQWVLAELGNYLREKTARGQLPLLVEELEKNPDYQIIPADDASFRAGLELYAKRVDKEWSFVDCTSIATMERLSLREALTADRHFQQAGFNALLL